MSGSANSRLHNNSPYTKNSIDAQKFFGKTVTGTMTVISDSRFEVNLDGYSEKAIDIFRNIPSRNYGKLTIFI